MNCFDFSPGKGDITCSHPNNAIILCLIKTSTAEEELDFGDIAGETSAFYPSIFQKSTSHVRFRIALIMHSSTGGRAQCRDLSSEILETTQFVSQAGSFRWIS
jgi:hypothetical protein